MVPKFLAYQLGIYPRSLFSPQSLHPPHNYTTTTMGAWTQLFPPAPHFTEAQTPPLTGKVFIVTGGSSGVGYELVKILYSKGGTVYMAGRSPSKLTSAIQQIKSEVATSPTTITTSPGKLNPLTIDLSDLTTIAPFVSTFLSQESRLDVLFNNAGVSRQPAGSLTTQGHEIHMGTNCLGPYLLTKLLLPILASTAQSSPPSSVRVVFTSSGIIDMPVGPTAGISLDELKPGSHSADMNRNYSASKAGNWFLASGFDKRYAKDGIVSVVQNPGMLRTPGWDGTSWVMRALMAPVFHPPKMGAYTVLWAGLSEDVKSGYGGRMIIPWGRWNETPRGGHLESLKGREEGGTGLAGEFWEWCEGVTGEFAG